MIKCEMYVYVYFNMVYCLLHYLHYNGNTTSLVHLFSIVVIFVIEISCTQRLIPQMILSCMYMYVCMYVCTYVCMYVYMYVCIYVCIYVYMNCVYMYVCVYVLCVCVCIYIYICMCACICVCLYICMYVSGRRLLWCTLRYWLIQNYGAFDEPLRTENVESWKFGWYLEEYSWNKHKSYSDLNI